MTICPLCNKALAKRALRNHILTTARNEAFVHRMNKEAQTLHLEYVDKYYKKTNKKELEIK